MSDVVTVLMSHPAFAGVPTDDLRQLAAELFEAEPRQRILTYGDPATSVFVVVEGMIRVYHDDGSRQLTVKHLQAPATFGEMEALSGNAYLENAEALSHCRIVRIPARVFVSFVDTHASVAAVLLRDVCARFCVAARNERVPFGEVDARLASLVLAYAELFGRETSDGLRIKHKLTLQDFAYGLGVTIRSVTRTVTAWKKNDWLVREKGWFVVRDRKALEALAGDLRANINYKFEQR